MLDLNTLHQINTDKEAYKKFREAADRACGHELEAKRPAWFIVNYIGTNLIPGTEAPSVIEFHADVVIPNEYGCMQQPESIEGDMWLEMLDGDHSVTGMYDRVEVVKVFDENAKNVYSRPELS